MRFEPYPTLGDRPHVVVDGAPNDATALLLSHWPRQPGGDGTPRALRADTSAEIVFRWLAAREPSVDVELASNNHFDEDGLVGLFALIDPGAAIERRARLIDVASAGDFATCTTRDAARTACTIAAFADPERSPLARATFAGTDADRTAALYSQMLPRLAELVDAPERFRRLWEDEDARIDHDVAAIASGAVRIEEVPELDLAVVTLPAHAAGGLASRFAGQRRECVHPIALHAATSRTCILTHDTRGGRHEVLYRYETWVQLASRRPRARRDLSVLARQASPLEPSGARWTFDGVSAITPRLRLDEAQESGLDPARFRALLEDALRTLPAAWDPYLEA